MSDMTERNCNKCIHHTSGNCDSWDCNMQTVEDVKKEAVNEYVKVVVDELEERTDFLKKCTKYGNKNEKQQAESYSTMMMYEVADLVDDAIEIVKHGGAYDDVCEWKYTKEIMDNAEFKVGCNPNALKRGVVPNNFSYHDFKYCPYCGKKINVVE